MDNSQQLVSNYVRSFVENDGGSLRFAPIRDEDGRMCWELYGILPDGTERKVMLSKTGKPQEYFKSPTQLLPTGKTSTQRRARLRFQYFRTASK